MLDGNKTYDNVATTTLTTDNVDNVHSGRLATSTSAADVDDGNVDVGNVDADNFDVDIARAVNVTSTGQCRRADNVDDDKP